jgi:8-oxo-dGTP pyrophosphatase MutT (NUDIX family)
MQLVSENLVVVTRGLEPANREVLLGKKLRGPFADKDVFPGGKTERRELQFEGVERELYEETGIDLDPDTDPLRYVGKLLINDYRESSRRFGNVFIYLGRVSAGTVAQQSAELETRWVNVNDPTLADNMPPDVALWWPSVRDFDGNPTITHVNHYESGALEVITKEPDFQNSLGRIIQSQIFEVQ